MVVRYTQEELEQMPVDVLDRMAFGCSDGQVLRIPPAHITIAFAQDLENPKHRFSAKGFEWAQRVDLSEPVLVSVDDEGRFCLEDGHHRYLAAHVRGQRVLARVQIKGNPVRAILRRQDQEVANASGARCVPVPKL